MSFTIEIAENDEKSFTDVFELLLQLHKEGGYAPLDADAAARHAYLVLSEGRSLVARSADGKSFGTLALAEQQFWYAQESFLQDAWVFVSPRHRRGKVGVELMRRARDLAQEAGKIAFVTVNNPDRRQKKTKMALVSQTAGYVPIGYSIKAR